MHRQAVRVGLQSDKQAEILVNGKKKRRARLVHGDRVTLGDVDLSFSIFDEPQKVGHSPGEGARASVSETQLDISSAASGRAKFSSSRS